MSLNVLQHKLEIMHVSLHSFIEKESNWIAIITYVLHNDTEFCGIDVRIANVFH
jgi:hypothetical protein